MPCAATFLVRSTFKIGIEDYVDILHTFLKKKIVKCGVSAECRDKPRYHFSVSLVSRVQRMTELD